MLWARIGLGAVLCVLTLLLGSPRAWAEDVTVWNYHNYPPYIVDIEKERGLSYDLARILTSMSEGRYQFRVTVLPRERLNMNLEAGQPGMVLWANHAWFGDDTRTRYLWTDPILNDRNVVISPMSVGFDYDGPRSLTGMTMVGVRGHKYQDVGRLIEYGLVRRVDVRGERNLLQFVASGRGRVAIVAESAVRYFVQELDLGDEVYIAREPHSRYQRHILVQPDLVGVHSFIQSAMPTLRRGAEWGEIALGYGVTAASMP